MICTAIVGLVFSLASPVASAQTDRQPAAGNASSTPDVSFELQEAWLKFKELHGKSYPDEHVELERRRIFQRNVYRVLTHNFEHAIGLRSSRLALNEFGDLQTDEFAEIMTGIRKLGRPAAFGRSRWPPVQPTRRLAGSARPTVDDSLLPRVKDWRDDHVVTPVKDQGACGSCWAFASVCTLESHHAIRTGRLLELSEQALVDCAVLRANGGCGGGLIEPAFRWVQRHGGLPEASGYPYEAEQSDCRLANHSRPVACRGLVRLPAGDEAALKRAVARRGPVAAAIDASSLEMQFYAGGIFEDHRCLRQVNHGVAIVGYSEEAAKPHWIVKNSWGRGWGEQGYLRLRMGKNMCGVAELASYPLVG